MIRTLLLAASVTVAIAAPASAAVNLVSNGSFEAGLSSWAIGGADAQNFPPVAITYGAAAAYPLGAFGEAIPANNAPTNSPDAVGAHAAYFVTDLATSQSLSQTLYLSEGIYQIGFSAYAPANGYRNRFEARFSGTIADVVLANYAVSSGPATTWQTFSGSKTITTAGNYLVSFVFDTSAFPAKDVVIDQVYIIAGSPGVPEPATWAMLITGFGMVGFAARHRKALAA